MNRFIEKRSSFRRGIVAYFIFALVAFSTSNVFAVTLIEDNRSTRTINDDGSTTFTPSAPFADWVSGLQNSSVSENQFSGNGSGYGESDFFFSISDSTFDVTFSTAVATAIVLSGSLYGEDGDFGFGEALVRLYAGDSTSDPLLFSASGGSSSFFEFNFVDTLDVGVYRLVLDTNITPGGFGTTADWEFTADFTAVPIPAVGWLFGVLVFGLYRRK